MRRKRNASTSTKVRPCGHRGQYQRLLILLDTVAAPLAPHRPSLFLSLRPVAPRKRCAFAAAPRRAASSRKTLPFCGLAAAASAAAAFPSAARASMPFKQYEITPGDWRNLEKWDAYRIAVSDMADRTSTERVAWTDRPRRRRCRVSDRP